MKKMKILIADRFSERARAKLEKDGFEVLFEPDLADDSLKDAIAESHADVLVVRSTRVTGDMLKSGKKLGLVVRAGAGYNTIDVQTAKERGIHVANCPGKNSNAVAELAFGLMIALDRHIPANVQDLRKGIWDKKKYSNSRGLFGRTLGLIGVGSIGRAMIPRACGFGMPVVAWSRSLTPERARELGIEALGSPIEVAAASNVLSVHVALTGDTRNLIDKAIFDAMRPGSLFINTSRAEVVDELALAWAVRERGIRAGVDVLEGEPSATTGTIENSLLALDGVIGTHHIGGATDEAQQAIADETVRILCEYRATGIPPNLVE